MGSEIMSFTEMDVSLSQLQTKREECIRARATAEANLAAKKTRLKELLKKFEALGMNPDNADEEIRKASQVLSVKIKVLQEEMEAAHRVLMGGDKEV